MDYYFDSYSHFGIHEEMLKDTVRTLAYRNAILKNRHLFEGKVVLDVGCGTGILSMFAAEAGARLVIGVDMSSLLEDVTPNIVRRNGFADRIVLLRGKMEELTLPVPEVDIILSEWMGYCLLYESMLDTVLWARDRYLNKENGLMFPNEADLYLCGIEDAQYKAEKLHFWDNVYGYDMACLGDIARREPLVDVVDSQAVVTDNARLLRLDLQTCKLEDLSFGVDFGLRCKRPDWLHAWLAHFTCTFSHGQKPIVLPTGPFDKYTHWKQSVFYLPLDVMVAQGDVVRGRFCLRPNARNHRELDVDISYYLDATQDIVAPSTNGNDDSNARLISMQYHMC